MKKSKIQEIIREEIQNILTESEDPIQLAFNKKIDAGEPSGSQNTMRSKEWMEGKRAYVKGEQASRQPKNPYARSPGNGESKGVLAKKATEWTLGMNSALKLDPKPYNTDSKIDASSYYADKGSGGFTGD